MGKSCCESKASELESLRAKQGRVLKIVLALNFLMFITGSAIAGLFKELSSPLATGTPLAKDT